MLSSDCDGEMGEVMRKSGLAAMLAASVALSACVQTRQYADLQFTPPQGDYKLLVLRPDVTVGSLTTGGLVEPRADWTDQARASIIDALRAQQATRGGKATFIERRTELPGVTADELADVERLNAAVAESIGFGSGETAADNMNVEGHDSASTRSCRA